MPEMLHTIQEQGGRWRWLYKDTDKAVELRSSATYETRGEAEQAASQIYLGVPIEVVEAPEVERGAGAFARGPLVAPAVISLIALAVFFFVVRAIGRRAGGTPDRS